LRPKAALGNPWLKKLTTDYTDVTDKKTMTAAKKHKNHNKRGIAVLQRAAWFTHPDSVSRFLRPLRLFAAIKTTDRSFFRMKNVA
jgi:hypothetical protein